MHTQKVEERGLLSIFSLPKCPLQLKAGSGQTQEPWTPSGHLTCVAATQELILGIIPRQRPSGSGARAFKLLAL